MAKYTKINLSEVEDSAVKFGHAPDMETRFSREALGTSNIGITYQRLAPGYAQPFSHVHSEQEEVLFLLKGSMRVRLDDEVVELMGRDLLRVAPGTLRQNMGGPDGAEYLVIGDRVGHADAEVKGDTFSK